MWWDITSDDFVPSSGNVTTDLGHLSQSKFQGFKKLQNELQIRVLEHKATKKHPHIAVTAIDRSMYHVSEWLDNLPATLNQIRYFVTAFQCYFLELCSTLDYLEIYEPHINGLLPSTTVTTNTIGAFTSDACIVQASSLQASSSSSSVMHTCSRHQAIFTFGIWFQLKNPPISVFLHAHLHSPMFSVVRPLTLTNMKPYTILYIHGRCCQSCLKTRPSLWAFHLQLCWVAANKGHHVGLSFFNNCTLTYLFYLSLKPQHLKEPSPRTLA